MKFENREQAEKYLREWQHRLFLDDWIIKINLVDCIDDEENCVGKVDYNREYLYANIRIKKELNEDAIDTQCHEKVLVHELMHLVILQTENYEDIQNLYWNEKQHQIMERMTRSLILAKYDLSFDFFVNKD
jgi:hypothetical protein